MTTPPLALVEVDLFHKATGHVHRFHFATGPYTTQRGDTAPDVPYAPLVVQAADIKLTIASYGAAAGDTRVEVGETHLSNVVWRDGMPDLVVYDVTADAWLTIPCPAGARPLSSVWTDYTIGGRPIRILIGPANGSRDTDFDTVLTSTMEMPEPERDTIILRPRDGALDFDTALLVDTYPGTDTEGAATLAGPANMKDVLRERCFGHVPSCSPTYLGKTAAGLHLFSVNGGHPIEGVVVVRDGYVDLEEVTSGTPAAGQWKQDKTTGIFVLGGDYFFGITCEVKGDKTGGVWRTTGADLIRFLATDHSGLKTTADLDSASFTAINAAAPYTLNLYLPAGATTTHREAYDLVTRSFRGGWLVDPLGRLAVVQVLPAAGSAVATLRKGVDHTGLVPLSPAEGRVMPAKAALIRFAQNHAPASDGDIDVRYVTADAKALAVTPWREARTADDAAVVAAYGANNARVVERETLITARPDAETEGLALRDDAKVPRPLYELPCTQLFPQLARLDLVLVYDDLPGFEAGKLVRIIGAHIDQRAQATTFTVRE